MKVEVWSDVMCPFCFVGKHKLEKALDKLPFKEQIEIEWKSFLLMPNLQVDKTKDIFDFIAQEKGQSREWAIQMHQQITEMGKEVGVDFHFEKTIPANTFQAHRLLQMAKTEGKGTVAEEKLFRAFFTEGKDVEDVEVLLAIGRELKLSEDTLSLLATTNAFSDVVERDMYEAKQINVRGVPYFVFNDRYAVSGAQDVATFEGVLEKSFQEWLQKNPDSNLTIIEGKVCRIDGMCD